MTANDLIAAFETLADAPDGVKRLRELVLRLAVRGKLVAQLPTDIPPAARASDTAALKRDNLWKLSSIDALPSTWRIVPFANLGQWGSGGTPLKGHPEYYDGDIPWLKIGDLNDGLVTTAETTISMEGLANSAAKMVPPGVLLVAMYGSIGKSGITGIRCCTNQAIAHCIPDLALVTLQYVFRLVGAMRHDLEMQGKGAAQQNISQTVLRHLLVPLPPLAEQHRIVTRVDELMGLLDRLEAARTARDDVRRAARDAALAALRDAEDTDAVEAAWGRIAGQMDALFAEPEDVGPLRQAVLGLAVRGRLVPQDPSDGHVEDALASIKRQRLRAGTLKLDYAAAFGVLNPSAWPYVPPKSWRMLSFGDVFVDVFTGPFGTSLKADEYVEGGTPVVNPQNLRNGTIVPTHETCVGPGTIARLRTFLLSDRDIVVARRGEMGRCAVVTPREAGWLCGTGSLVLKPPLELAPQFAALFLTSPWTVERLGGDSVGSTMKNLNQKIMANLPFGFPPLPEQHRIVAKVDALMATCDALEARLTTARNLHGQFAAAAVHHLDV